MQRQSLQLVDVDYEQAVGTLANQLKGNSVGLGSGYRQPYYRTRLKPPGSLLYEEDDEDEDEAVLFTHDCAVSVATFLYGVAAFLHRSRFNSSLHGTRG